MAGIGDDDSQSSVGRWGDEPRRHRGHRHHREDGCRRYDLHRFIQMGPSPLTGGETPGAAEDWLERMEECFRVFHCTDEQRLEATSFLLTGQARKWWRLVSAELIHERGQVLWADFRQAFRNHHFSPALRQTRALELLNLKQGNLSIAEYQQRFTALLSYCPYISESSVAKYDHFLNGLNQEIFDRVSVCDDPTSYEGLVNRCRQAEISVNRCRMLQSSRPASSLGPHSQSFKKSGASSSSGSGNVFRFGGKKRESCCDICGRKHLTEECRRAYEACFLCGEMGHLKKDCPRHGGSGSGSQASVSQSPPVAQQGGIHLRPRAQG